MSRSDDDLIEAMYEGHEGKVAWALEEGAYANQAWPDDMGDSLLLRAVRTGAHGTAELLLAYDADAEAVDAFGNNALIIALQAKKHIVKIVNLLLAAGADPAQANNQGDTFMTVLRRMEKEGALSHADSAALKAKVIGDPLQVVFNRTAGSMMLEEVYLFDTLERITYARPASGGNVQGMCREAFSAIADSASLRRAFEEHVARAGNASEVDVFGSKSFISFSNKG